MPQAEITRLTIVWSKDTDLALRSHLGAQGFKKGALSKFVEDAVKWRLCEQTGNQAREAFASVPAGELRDTIDHAILNVRKHRRRQLRGRPRK
jgi:hypothetical protein